MSPLKWVKTGYFTTRKGVTKRGQKVEKSGHGCHSSRFRAEINDPFRVKTARFRHLVKNTEMSGFDGTRGGQWGLDGCFDENKPVFRRN